MTKTKIILLTLLSICLISFGWFLEIYYYEFRFIGDGISPIISRMIGISLTLLLSMLFISSNWKTKTARVILIVFSVFCTSSGQGVQYNEINNLNSEKIVLNSTKQSVFDEYSQNINTIKQQIENKNKLLPNDLKDRAYLNTNGVQPLLKEIEDLRVELKRYEALRDGTINSLSTTNNTNLSAYELLANDLGYHSPTLIKLLSQLLLSLFIALMAPTGIMILSTVYQQPSDRGGKEVKKDSHTLENTKPDTNKSTVSNTERSREKVTKDSVLMYLERWGKSEFPSVLRSRSTVCGETDLSTSVFNHITDKARKLGLIKSTGNSTVPCVKRSEFLLMYKNNLRVGEKVAVRG